jgi:hypothetical protein
VTGNDELRLQGLDPCKSFQPVLRSADWQNCWKALRIDDVAEKEDSIAGYPDHQVPRGLSSPDVKNFDPSLTKIEAQSILNNAIRDPWLRPLESLLE